MCHISERTYALPGATPFEYHYIYGVYIDGTMVWYTVYMVACLFAWTGWGTDWGCLRIVVLMQKMQSQLELELGLELEWELELELPLPCRLVHLSCCRLIKPRANDFSINTPRNGKLK